MDGGEARMPNVQDRTAPSLISFSPFLSITAFYYKKDPLVRVLFAWKNYSCRSLQKETGCRVKVKDVEKCEYL